MKFAIIFTLTFVLLIPISIFAQSSDCFYENETYEFSFDIPCNWAYWENVILGDGITTYQVVLTHEKGTFEALKEEGYTPGLLDVFSGLPFPIQAPHLGMIFLNVPESEISPLNAGEIKRYEREFVMTNLPSAKIINLDVETKSWGWIATAKVSASIVQTEIISEGKTYYFKDRESYSIALTSASELFDAQYYVFENALENLKIRGINVNEPEIVPVSLPTGDSNGGGCLIATATYGTELAPQVQQLREIRDNKLLQTKSGTNFMNSFNAFYYSFSPIIADYERENQVFKEMVKLALIPMISSLSILNYVDLDSEVEVLGYGISMILLNLGMYVGIPTIVIMKIRK